MAPSPDLARAPSPAVLGPAFAALDLGTNNCRLLVGAPASDGFRVLDSLSRVVRLGEGLHASGCLSEDAMDRTLAALHLCAERLAARRPAGLRAIATEACRRAANGRAFLDRVRAETGLAFDVISAREEAALAIESCAPLLARLAVCGLRRALLLDIGGGSTELAWVRLPDPRRAAADGADLIGTVSVPLGVIDVAEAWGGQDSAAHPPEQGAFDATVQTIADHLSGFDGVHRITQEIRQGGVALVGTSGTVTTLAGLALGLPRYRRALVDGVMLTAEAALQAVAQLRAMSPQALTEHPCVGADRMAFVLPGCAIFKAIHQAWPAPSLLVADRGLREGMVLRMIRESRTRRPHRAAAVAA